MSYGTNSNIFATMERQQILDDFGIKYAVDQDLNFEFPDAKTKKRAIQLLEDALEL